ncbi:MAG: putative addiction module antidote protein [Flavobacteriales bacterium]
MTKSKFDISEYLNSNKMIAEYLNTALEDGDDEDVVIALGHIAKAIGIAKISEETGLSRTSLYKALAEGAKPQFATILKVLGAVGGQLSIEPKRVYNKKMRVDLVSEDGAKYSRSKRNNPKKNQ